MKSRNESLNNDKSYEKIKKRNSRSRSRKRSINAKFNRRKKSESDESEYENSLNIIRKKSESSKRRRRIKSHIINGNQSEEDSKEKSKEENKENKVKSEEENKEKSEEESENSLNAIRKKIRQYKRDNSSVSTIRKNSSVKSDDDSDSKATVILTAENRLKYGFGEINIK